jgi:uncharacterized protein YciI
MSIVFAVRGERQRLIIRFRAGPTWTSGPPEDQLGWDEHADFIDELVERGTMVMGGPLSDYSGSVSLWEGVTVEEARRIAADDPFMKNGVFVLDEILEWKIYVDELTGSPA